MARSVATIQSQIQDTLVANFATIGITIDATQWSKRNFLRLLCFIFATCTAYLEQLLDVFKASIELTVSKASAASQLWVQKKMFEFQYNASNPQIIQLINLVAVYPVIDPTLNIITACSVTTALNNAVKIKVAKSNPFVALSSLEIAAAQSYINIIGTAGIQYNIISLDADKIYINADIFYQGQYSSIIQANVIDAINVFLQGLSINNFDGVLKMTDLENTIRNVVGVNDVVLKNVFGRANTIIFANATELILNNATISRQWKTLAGYIVGETTAGKTFSDSLNFLAE